MAFLFDVKYERPDGFFGRVAFVAECEEEIPTILDDQEVDWAHFEVMGEVGAERVEVSDMLWLALALDGTHPWFPNGILGVV